MKKLIFSALVTVLSLPILFFALGKYFSFIGERDSRWITNDMWGSTYFGARAADLSENEKIYLKSLSKGASKEQQIISYVVKNKCYDSTWDCSLIMTSASNLMIDSQDYETGLRGAIEAYQRIPGMCPIIYETSILRYKLEKLAASNSNSTTNQARSIINKIKTDGGIMTDLRGKACKKLIVERPEYFTTYTILISKMMEISGGNNSKAAAYIRSLKNNVAKGAE